MRTYASYHIMDFIKEIIIPVRKYYYTLDVIYELLWDNQIDFTKMIKENEKNEKLVSEFLRFLNNYYDNNNKSNGTQFYTREF